jgi:Uma2 family endonuclease
MSIQIAVTTQSSQSDTATLYITPQSMYDDVCDALSQCQVDLRYDGHQLELPRVIERLTPSAYSQFLTAIGNHRLRHSYAANRLETSPRKSQPRHSRFIGRLIEHATLVDDIPIQSVGNMTLTNPAFTLGVEPDESFYTANESRVRCKPVYEPEIDPPPDLLVEIDSPHEVVPRMEVFAKLGVTEIWLCGKDTLIINILREGKYEPTERSWSFSQLTGPTIMRFVNMRFDVGDTAATRRFGEWLQQDRSK